MNGYQKLLSVLVFILLLIVSLIVIMWADSCRAEEGLRHIFVKSGDCHTMAAGWVCYDEPSSKKLDEVQKEGIDLKVQLKQRDARILELSKGYLGKHPEPETRWFQKSWVKYSIGALMGIGLGMGIGFSS